MSENQILIELSAILSLGLAASLLAGWFKAPSILFLLIAGLVAGPVTGLINPQAVFGPLVKPTISLCTAIILFEGGMWLRISEFKRLSKAISALVIWAALIALLLITVVAHYILNVSWMLSLFIGSILIVTGPTVIAPMLQQIRPKGVVPALLKWEGIVVDLIGTVLVVLVFEIMTSDPMQAPIEVAWALTKAILMGLGIGYFGGKLLAFILRSVWIPQRLHHVAVLFFVIVGFVASNSVQHDSGLLAVAIMGFILINSEDLNLHHVVEFKENLQVLLIPLVFVILSAQLPKAYLENLSWHDLLFPAALIFFVRPVSIIFSTFRSGLSWAERLFIAGIAPRGIIAAAMASFFSLELQLIKYPGSDGIVQIVFGVILCTVAFYGILAGPWARFLKLAESNPQGILLLGAQEFAVRFALALQTMGLKVKVIDTNQQHVIEAQKQGLDAETFNLLLPDALAQFDLSGIGKLVAFTSNDEVNAMSSILMAPVLGKSEVYQLAHAQTSHRKSGNTIGGEELFSPGVTADYLSHALQNGASFEVIPSGPDGQMMDMTLPLSTLRIPLAIQHEDGKVAFLTSSAAPVTNAKDKWLTLTIPNNTTQTEQKK